MSQVDDVIARSQELLDRTRMGDAGVRARKRREGEVIARVTRIAVADAVILVAAVIVGFFLPLGMFGALAVIALLIAVTVILAMAPVTAEPVAEKLPGAPLKILPLQTQAWLDRQRAILPAPAQTLVDQIAQRLSMLGQQVATLDEGEPAASEIRKLVGEQLPELVKGYAKVPEPLRRTQRNGRTPDEQLVEGLRVIEGEIGEMSSHLAQGDLDSLATRERYLQIRYQGDGEG